MRHHNAGRKFDRNTSSRRAMFRNLTANLVLNERIEFMGAVPEPMFLEAVLAAVSEGDGAEATGIEEIEPAAEG